MTTPSNWFLGICLLSPIAVFYFLVIQWRRSKYKSLADHLSANYVSEGLFKTGKIIGMRNAREFVIKTSTTNSGKSMSFLTSVSMGCQNKGIDLLIDAAFFKNFPDWRKIAAVGEKTVRVFLTDLTLPSALSPLDDRYKSKIVTVFNGLTGDVNIIESLGELGRIHVETDQVWWQVRGILKDGRQIERILLLLEKISVALEATPII